MQKFTTYKGTTVPLMNDNIDTDQIIPKQFLKAIDKKSFGKNLFFEWRYNGNNYEQKSEFILNNENYKNATILISGYNFGSGSSREHAAWALFDYGFKVIIAGSFSDIFYNNAIKTGLLPIIQPRDVLIKFQNLNSNDIITIDLKYQKITTPIGNFIFDIDATWKHKLINGLDDIGITLNYEQNIKKYEENLKNKDY